MAQVTGNRSVRWLALGVAVAGVLSLTACESSAPGRHAGRASEAKVRNADARVGHTEPFAAPADHLRHDGAREAGGGDEATGAAAMARQRYDARLSDDGTIPRNALLSAKQEADRMEELAPATPSRDGGIWNWEWLGPGDIGGRIRAIAVHPSSPNRIFVGAASGGIWRTDNAGGSWTPVNDFLASLAVNTIVYDPSDPEIMYGGTGEGIFGGGNGPNGKGNYAVLNVPGAGCFKSIDGGTTWNPLTQTTNDPNNWTFVNRLSVSPNSPNVVIAATNSGVWRSGDHGDTWDQVWVGNAFDVKFRPNAGSTRALAGLADGTILFSTDLGQTWDFAQVSGNLNTTALSTNHVSGATIITVISTDGFANSDVIRIGGANPETAYIKQIKTETNLQLFSTVPLRFNHNTGDTVTLLSPAVVSTATTIASTPDPNDPFADPITVTSTAGLVPRDQLLIGNTNANQEIVRISAIVSGTQLSVSDLSNPHAIGEPVRTVRALSGGGRAELAWAGGGVCYASVDRGLGAILRSTDFGSTFTPLADTSVTADYLASLAGGGQSQGSYDNSIWVSSVDNDFIVVGGPELWRDDDVGNGLNLTRISDWLKYHTGGSAHADQHMILEHPAFDGAGNKTVYVANDGGIQRTDDIAAIPFFDTIDWTNLAHNLGITQFFGAAAAPDGSVMIGGSQDNGISRYREIDGALDWFQCDNCTGDGGFSAVDHLDPDIMYATTQFLTVKKSTDGGESYSAVIDGLSDAEDPNRAPFIAPFVMSPSNRNILVAGGQSIWYTADGASHWASVRGPIAGSPFCSAIDIAPDNPDDIWVGYQNGRISRTTIGVTNWDDVDPNDPNDPNAQPPNRWVTDIAINPGDPNQVFVTFGGYLPDSVWYTPNGGLTWFPRHGDPNSPIGLPNIHINTVRWHPTVTDWVYVGTDLGVFASEDAGLTWSRTPRYGDQGHEGPVNIEVSELFWQGDYLVAATFGRGVYRTRPLSLIYVDQTQPGCLSSPPICPDGCTGSLICPYNTVQECVAAQGHGTDVLIKVGDYNETDPVVFLKRGEVRATGSGSVVIR